LTAVYPVFGSFAGFPARQIIGSVNHRKGGLFLLAEIHEVEIERIDVGRRIRRNTGDLASLMTSLKRFGQLTPIILSPNYGLIAGFRRLESARRLGWKTIKAVFIQRDTELERLEVEIEENIQRRELSPEEISDGLDRLDRLRNPGPIRRFFRFLRAIVHRLVHGLKRLFGFA
jgi:ParB family chromosome partitioning protein